MVSIVTFGHSSHGLTKPLQLKSNIHQDKILATISRDGNYLEVTQSALGCGLLQPCIVSATLYLVGRFGY